MGFPDINFSHSNPERHREGVIHIFKFWKEDISFTLTTKNKPIDILLAWKMGHSRRLY